MTDHNSRIVSAPNIRRLASGEYLLEIYGERFTVSADDFRGFAWSVLNLIQVRVLELERQRRSVRYGSMPQRGKFFARYRALYGDQPYIIRNHHLVPNEGGGFNAPQLYAFLETLIGRSDGGDELYRLILTDLGFDME